MAKYVSEYDVGLNPIVNEAQLDKAIKDIDAKLRKVRSGAHEALATQLQALLKTIMRVARLPSPTKAMEYIANTTQGGYTFAQRRVITSGVGKAMTEIRGATQAEAAAKRAQDQDKLRTERQQAQREREQARLDRWFVAPRRATPLEQVQNMVLSQIDNNTAAENLARVKTAAQYAAKQKQFDVQRRDLLRQGLTLRAQGGTENQLVSWQNKVAKFADSWQQWAKQDKKNANTLNTLLSRAKNPTAEDLARLNTGSSGGAGNWWKLLKGGAGLYGVIRAVDKGFKYLTRNANLARDLAANRQYSFEEQQMAQYVSNMEPDQSRAMQRDTQLFTMRAMMGDISENEWMGMSILGSDVYRAYLSGDQARVNEALRNTRGMDQNLRRYALSLIGREDIMDYDALPQSRLDDLRATARREAMSQEALAAEQLERATRAKGLWGRARNVVDYIADPLYSTGASSRAWQDAEAIVKARGGSNTDMMLEYNRLLPIYKEQLHGSGGGIGQTKVESGAVQINIENKFDSDDPNVGRKISDQISREFSGLTWDDFMRVQQLNAGGAK